MAAPANPSLLSLRFHVSPQVQQDTSSCSGQDLQPLHVQGYSLSLTGHTVLPTLCGRIASAQVHAPPHAFRPRCGPVEPALPLSLRMYSGPRSAAPCGWQACWKCSGRAGGPGLTPPLRFLAV